MKHRWKGQQQGGNPAEIESYEWVCYCDNCGVEMDDDNEDEDCPLAKKEKATKIGFYPVIPRTLLP
jgi:rubrerythrin